MLGGPARTAQAQGSGRWSPEHVTACYGSAYPFPDLKFRRGANPMFSAEAPCELQRLLLVQVSRAIVAHAESMRWRLALNGVLLGGVLKPGSANVFPVDRSLAIAACRYGAEGSGWRLFVFQFRYLRASSARAARPVREGRAEGTLVKPARHCKRLCHCCACADHLHE